MIYKTSLILAFILFCAPPKFSLAEEVRVEETQEATSDFWWVRDFSLSSLIPERVVPPEKDQTPIFRPYRLNYFIFTNSTQKYPNDVLLTGAEDSSADFTRQQHEAKFQISFIARVREFGAFSLNFFYTQRSFWQITDERHSRPFRESNYNPGVFLQYQFYFKDSIADLLAGFDHVSNGQVEPISRSQNRLFLALLYKKKRFGWEFKYLQRIPEKEKKYPNDPAGDENPDLYKYQGFHEILFAYDSDIYLGAVLKGNAEYGHYHFELDMGFPLERFDINQKLHIQYFNGYLESMIDYNRHITKWGIGLMFGL